MMNEVIRELQRIAKANGIEIFGTAPVTPWQSKPGHAPTDFLPSAQAVIVVASPIPRQAMLLMPLRNSYKVESLNNQQLNLAAFAITRELERMGSKAIMIPAADYADFPKKLEIDPSYKEIMIGDLSLKYAGTQAGIGVIGRNSMLLHPTYGPLINLAGVITDARLPVGKPLHLDFCEGCDLCIKACFTGALDAAGTYDPLKCQNDPEGKQRLVFVDYLVCPAPCRIVCPVGQSKSAKRINHPELDPLHYCPFDTHHKVP